MRTTIKMIAERAGVSIGTVDRVLHDRPYVKAEVRERVLRVMEELDYHPNRMASALATSPSMSSTDSAFTTSPNTGRVAGCRGVNTVQQSS